METMTRVQDPAKARAYFEQKMAFITGPVELDRMLKSHEAITLIDVREREDFEKGHIPGAINIPHRTMSAESTSRLDRAALIVTYCDGIGCNGSTKGAVNMLNLGFRVKELMGGLDWWKRDGHKTHIAATSGTSISCGCE